METEQTIIRHVLVPEHIRLSPEEKKKVLEQYNISKKQLPRILQSDSAIKHLAPDTGDVIKIMRKSQTNKETVFYRVVVRG